MSKIGIPAGFKPIGVDDVHTLDFSDSALSLDSARDEEERLAKDTSALDMILYMSPVKRLPPKSLRAYAEKVHAIIKLKPSKSWDNADDAFDVAPRYDVSPLALAEFVCVEYGAYVDGDYLCYLTDRINDLVFPQIYERTEIRKLFDSPLRYVLTKIVPNISDSMLRTVISNIISWCRKYRNSELDENLKQRRDIVITYRYTNFGFGKRETIALLLDERATKREDVITVLSPTDIQYQLHVTTACPRINVEYDPTCPDSDLLNHVLIGDLGDDGRFHGGIAEGDIALSMRQIQTFFSAYLVQNPNIKRSCVAQGVGGDGKGVLNKLAKKMFGDAIVPMALVECEGFGFARLEDKLGMVLPELADAPLSNDFVAFWKSLTGDDVVTRNKKYSNKGIDLSSVYMLICTNHEIRMSQLENKEAVFDRRVRFCEMPAVYKSEPDVSLGQQKADPHIFDRLVDEEREKFVLPSLFQLVLRGYEDLVLTGDYTKHRGSDRMTRQWLHTNDTVDDFLEETGYVREDGTVISWGWLFGDTWDKQHVALVNGTRTADLLAPVWMTEQEAAAADRAFSEIDGTTDKPDQLFYGVSRRSHRWSNDLQSVYGRYVTYCEENGNRDKGKLGAQNFSKLLKSKGFSTLRVDTRLGSDSRRKVNLVVPNFITSKSEYDAWRSGLAPATTEGEGLNSSAAASFAETFDIAPSKTVFGQSAFDDFADFIKTHPDVASALLAATAQNMQLNDILNSLPQETVRALAMTALTMSANVIRLGNLGVTA